MSMLPFDTSCGEEIKVAAKSNTCSASIFGSSLPLHVASRKPFLIFEVSTRDWRWNRLMLKIVSQLGSVDRLASGSTVTGDMQTKQRVGQREEQPEIRT